MYSDKRMNLRGRRGRLYRISELIYQASDGLHYAKKPFDLVYPITSLTDLVNQIRDLQMQWLKEEQKKEFTDRGTYPRL